MCEEATALPQEEGVALARVGDVFNDVAYWSRGLMGLLGSLTEARCHGLIPEEEEIAVLSEVAQRIAERADEGQQIVDALG